MYYRGDDFTVAERENQPDTIYPVTQAAYEGAYPGAPGANPGGFLSQLGETAATFGMFFAPFAPALVPALMATPIVGGAIKAGEKLAQGGGALWPIIAGTTTGATTTAAGGTSSDPSRLPPATSPNSPVLSSPLQPPPLVIYSPNLGPSAARKKSVLASQQQQAAVPRSSRAIRVSQHLSRAQQKTLSQEVLRLLQQ